MLTIRLSQVGKKNKKMFRLIVSEKTKDPFGDSLEILGSYNPHSKDLQLKADRLKHWIENGAELSPTVNNLLIEKKIITGKKVTSSSISKKRNEKIAKKQEDSKKAAADKAAKEAAAEEAKAAAAATPEAENVEKTEETAA
jgi:small subunit ribosomal protein S16